MGPTELVSGLLTMKFAVKLQNTIGVRIKLNTYNAPNTLHQST